VLVQLKDQARREDMTTMLVKSTSVGVTSNSTEITLTESDLPHTKLEDFNLLLVLGKGSFGKVCSVCTCCHGYQCVIGVSCGAQRV